MNARAELLDRVIAHVATHGVGDSSLRELAAAVGTSHRMLHYHFGGRDGLVAAIVEAIEEQQRDALQAIARTATSPREVVSAQWAELSQADTRPFVALFFEVLVLAARGAPGTESFLTNLTEPWVEVGRDVADGLGIEVDSADMRLGIAVVRGLLADAMATGDVDAASEALDRFLEIWPPPSARTADPR